MTVVGALGSGTPSNLPTSTSGQKWEIERANPIRNGWLRLYANDEVAAGMGLCLQERGGAPRQAS